MFVCTKNIHFKFQAFFGLNFVQVLYILYNFCIYVEMWCSFFVHLLSYKVLICTIFVYKTYTSLVFCIICVYIMYSFWTIFLVRVWIFRGILFSTKHLWHWWHNCWKVQRYHWPWKVCDFQKLFLTWQEIWIKKTLKHGCYRSCKREHLRNALFIALR